MHEDFFPDHYAEKRDERVEKAWSLDFCLPVPHEMPRCPACKQGRRGRMVLKDWRFHVQNETGSRSPYRVDVRVKCIDCSLVLTYGVAVPREYWYSGKRTVAKTSAWISWRMGKQALASQGFFDEPGGDDT